MSEHTTEPNEAIAFIKHLRDAWDCCGTCAGGVLAELVRESQALVVAEVERALVKAEALTQEAMGQRSQHWRGHDYADGLDHGIETTVGLVRDVLTRVTPPERTDA